MKKILIIFLVISLFTVLLSQTIFKNNLSKLHPAKTQIVHSKKGEIHSVLVSRNGKVKVDTTDLNEELYVIVEFKDTPLLLQKKQGKMSPESINTRFMKFETDMSELQAQVTPHLAPDAPACQILRRFSKIYCGVSLKASRGLVKTLYELPYVKSIRDVKKVYVDLDESVSLIGADSVWSRYSVMGDSIIIGILDTGIDYTHYALGSGFGPGYKVIGGYDIVNNDNDPMDDHFHGTFVAGVVAAAGYSIKGVAPHALLMAFKVISAAGWGYDDWIIEGIERAVDPDGNPNTDDGVDVMNLSIGGNGDPYDPLSVAIDNAVDLGVVCVVVAGNEGNYNSINSPGTALKAITVGASDKLDQIASFSSRGPNSITYGIKPDIIAPGVDIVSCVPGGLWGRSSGTSFSAPHVAGVAALLLNIHPDWTPQMIKSALLSQTVDVGEDVFTQGSGRVDALASAAVTTLTNPASLSFGLDDISQDIWTVTDTLKVINDDSLSQDYILQFSGTLAGLSLSADPAGFTLSPSQEQTVIIQLQVDNNSLPYPMASPPSYEGNLFVESTSDTLKIPWALLKTPMIRLTFDVPPYSIYISSNSTSYTKNQLTWSVGNTVAECILPVDRYNIVTHFHSLQGEKYVFYEDFLIDGFIDTLIYSSDAINNITISDIDEYGNPLGGVDLDNGSKIILTFPDSSYIRSYTFGSSISIPIYSSDFSQNFELQFNHLRVITDKMYIISHSLEGLSGNTTLINDPQSYVSQMLHFQFNPNLNNYFFTFAHGIHIIGYGNILSEWIIPCYPTENPDSIQIFLTNRIIQREVGYITAISGWDVNLNNSSEIVNSYVWVRPLYVTDGDSVASSWFPPPKKTDIALPDGGHLFFGNTAPFYYSYGYNNYYENLSILSFTDILGQSNEYKWLDLYKSNYSILQDSTVLITGALVDFELFTVSSPGVYTLKIDNPNYYLDQLQGLSQLWMTFDLGQNDPDSPALTSFKVKNSDGQVTNQFDVNEAGIIELSAGDFYLSEDYYFIYKELDQLGLYYKLYDDSSWNEIILAEEPAHFDSSYGRFYTADLTPVISQYTDSTVIDLKVYLTDFSGNITEQIMHPAFKIGEAIITGIEENIHDELVSIPLVYSLKQNYPNPFNPTTVISYGLPTNSDVELNIYNILGQKVKTLVNTDKLAGTYSITWDGRNEMGLKVASGIYIYKIEARNFVQCRKMILMK